VSHSNNEVLHRQDRPGRRLRPRARSPCIHGTVAYSQTVVRLSRTDKYFDIAIADGTDRKAAAKELEEDLTR
jgi:hypothetical protein